jgi:hypothetical protein
MPRWVQDIPGTIISAIFGFGWVFGGIVAPLYWASQGNAFQIALSILPLWGAISVILDFIR